MANFYDDTHSSLNDLLNLVRNEQDGSTLLIPDLQRPYVWNPNQVVLLIDSLIRGWPFGTFLTWKIKADDPVRGLARPFWKVINRTDGIDVEQVSVRNSPGSFRMVLDGQQRIQSLLLAVAGDSWGFKLSDAKWREALSDEKRRTRQDSQHWSLGCLCVDLEALQKEYGVKKKIQLLDFTTILQWVVTGGGKALSDTNRKKDYPVPLPNTDNSEYAERYIRLSSFWAAAPLSENVEQDQAEAMATKLLNENNVTQERIAALIRPVASLLNNIGRVRMTRVTFLELNEFNESIFSRDDYNDAVVNIFTRLNSAGRALTREDITFAWLKTGWVPTKTENKNATECFKELAESLKKSKLEISSEDLVAGVSFVWATVHNKGRILNNKDLLKGESIRPMAMDLSENWKIISEAITQASSFVDDRGIQHNQHYVSLNSLFVLWSWYYIYGKWCAAHGLKEVPKYNSSEIIKRTFTGYIDRWLICSQWSGKWSGNAVNNISNYAAALNTCYNKTNISQNPEEVTRLLSAFFEDSIKELEQEALKYVQTLQVSRREYVKQYFVPLWLWHRLEKERWEKSRIQLRTSKKKPSLDVDHTIAHALWERKLDQKLPNDVKDKEEALQIVNHLGNCALLEKNFNMSKSDCSIKYFLEQIVDFKEGRLTLTDWASGLQISDGMLDPADKDIDMLVQEIEIRETLIRKDLSEFITGVKNRVDISDAVIGNGE